MSREYYMDYRFIVKANEWTEFTSKIIRFLPEATDEIWYTEIQSGMLRDSEFTTKDEAGETE